MHHVAVDPGQGQPVRVEVVFLTCHHVSDQDPVGSIQGRDGVYPCLPLCTRCPDPLCIKRQLPAGVAQGLKRLHVEAVLSCQENRPDPRRGGLDYLLSWQLMPDPDLSVLETDSDFRVDEGHKLLPITGEGVLCHTARSHHERLKTLPVLLLDLRLIASHACPLTLRSA